jgi:hypothetical protein
MAKNSVKASVKFGGGNPHGGNRSKADARSKDSFAAIGGKADGYSKPSKGTGSGGGSVYHSAAKSKENIDPPDASEHGAPTVKGGPKSTNEY